MAYLPEYRYISEWNIVLTFTLTMWGYISLHNPSMVVIDYGKSITSTGFMGSQTRQISQKIWEVM